MVRSLGANKYRFWAGGGKTKRVRDEEQATGTGAGCRDPVEPIKIPIMSRRGVRKGAEGACGEEDNEEEEETVSVRYLFSQCTSENLTDNSQVQKVVFKI